MNKQQNSLLLNSQQSTSTINGDQTITTTKGGVTLPTSLKFNKNSMQIFVTKNPNENNDLLEPITMMMTAGVTPTPTTPNNKTISSSSSMATCSTPIISDNDNYENIICSPNFTVLNFDDDIGEGNITNNEDGTAGYSNSDSMIDSGIILTNDDENMDYELEEGDDDMNECDFIIEEEEEDDDDAEEEEVEDDNDDDDYVVNETDKRTMTRKSSSLQQQQQQQQKTKKTRKRITKVTRDRGNVFLPPLIPFISGQTTETTTSITTTSSSSSSSMINPTTQQQLHTSVVNRMMMNGGNGRGGRVTCGAAGRILIKDEKINDEKKIFERCLLNGGPPPTTFVLRNPRGNQPRTYNTDALWAALMDVKAGESIYR